MKLEFKPVSFDSFSVRSMFSIVKTDIEIFIDPSVAIAPKRYGLEPSKQELEELENKKDLIIKNYKNADLFIITHYHWDHCPNFEERHFEIFKSNAPFLIKDFNTTNKSQNKRARQVLSKAKSINNNFDFKIADNRVFEFENTYIEFSSPLNHGPSDILGKVIAVKISFKNLDFVFASDIQGINDNKTLNELKNFNPDFLVLSGPATYHWKWQNKYTKITEENIIKLMENTKVKTIIIDHHFLRDLKFKERLKKAYEKAKEFNVKLITAAEFLGIRNLQLEANRKNFKS